MNEVTRYEEGDPCAGMYKSSEGVWVHIDDYDQLKADSEVVADLVESRLAENLRLKAENERLHHAYLLSQATLLSLQGQDMVLRKQLDEAMRLLRYSSDECIPSLDREIDAWMERNNK